MAKKFTVTDGDYVEVDGVRFSIQVTNSWHNGDDNLRTADIWIDPAQDTDYEVDMAKIATVEIGFEITDMNQEFEIEITDEMIAEAKYYIGAFEDAE